jgi:hypothetical protein
VDQVEAVNITNCHAEQSEASPRNSRETLRFAQGDAERALTQFIRAAVPFDGDAVVAPVIDADQWNALAQIAGANNLTPVLYAALMQIEDSPAPPALVESLQDAYHQTKLANWVAFREVGELISIFEREKIALVLLKGAALAKTVYPAIAMRPMGDVDIFIRRDDAPRVRDILIARGFAIGLEPRQDYYDEFSYDQAFVRAGKYPLALEAHWHLFGQPYNRNRIPIEWFWDRTMPIRINDQTARAFAPSAQIIHLAAHAVLHHQGHNLLAAYDLALVLAQYRDQIDWDEIVKAARKFELSRILHAQLTRTRAAWGVAAPDDVIARLARAVGLRERILFAVNTSPHVEAHDLWDALNQPRGKSKLGYLKPILFPSRDYMLQRYGITNARDLPMHYARRLGRGAQMFARSVMAMARNVMREQIPGFSKKPGI